MRARNSSAQHSQSFESGWHKYGVKVVTPGTPSDAKGLLKRRSRRLRPLFIEGERLYNTKARSPTRSTVPSAADLSAKRYATIVRVESGAPRHERLRITGEGASAGCVDFAP